MSLKLEGVPSNELENYCICYNCLQLIHYFDISFVSHNQDDPHNILSCCIPCESILQMSRINMNGAERQKHMKEYLVFSMIKNVIAILLTRVMRVLKRAFRK